MVRARDWTEEEFETLLRNPGISDDELSELLDGRRSHGAVGLVRSGVHRFHTGQDNASILSQMMLSRLERGTDGLSCAICQRSLQILDTQ